MASVRLHLPAAALNGYGGSFSSCRVEMGHLVGGVGNALVEAVSPFDRCQFELFGSAGSMVVGVDSVGGPPHLDFPDESGG